MVHVPCLKSFVKNCALLPFLALQAMCSPSTAPAWASSCCTSWRQMCLSQICWWTQTQVIEQQQPDGVKPIQEAHSRHPTASSTGIVRRGQRRRHGCAANRLYAALACSVAATGTPSMLLLNCACPAVDRVTCGLWAILCSILTCLPIRLPAAVQLLTPTHWTSLTPPPAQQCLVACRRT